jgi:hypothetical protein
MPKHTKSKDIGAGESAKDADAPVEKWLDDWKMLLNGNLQSSLSLKDVNNFLHELLSASGKNTLQGLPKRLKEALGQAPPPGGGSSQPSSPQAKNVELSADMRQRIDGLGETITSLVSIGNSIQARIVGSEERSIEATRRSESNVAAKLDSVLSALGGRVSNQMEAIESRMLRLESSFADALERLENSFSLEDARQIIRLRDELAGDIEPTVKSQLREQLAPLLQVFEHHERGNTLTLEHTRNILRALRDRVVAAGLM